MAPGLGGSLGLFNCPVEGFLSIGGCFCWPGALVDGPPLTAIGRFFGGAANPLALGAGATGFSSA